ncbi:MAG TPA: CHASE2 domain-containing protein [Burkholderiaceae bacterium]|jgi:adenylate cyclase
MSPLGRADAPGIGLSPRRAAGLFVAALAISLLIGVAGLCRVPPVAQLDAFLLDTFERSFASRAPMRDVVVVDVDEISLASVGQWPWPRYRFATLIERIAAQKPAAIGLDIGFPEADRASLTTIQQAYKRDFGLDLAFSGLPDGLQDNDGYLGQVAGRAGVVGATYFYFDHITRASASPRPGVGFDGRIDLLDLPDAPGAMSNAEPIASQIRATGFMNVHPDADGVLRRMPLLIRHAGVIHPSLALATTLRALGVASGTIESNADGLAIRIGSHRVPIDAKGNALLRLDAASSGYAALSAADVLNGRFDPDSVRDKIVYIGSSAAGLNDIHATALDERFPGLKMHAAMSEGILQDRIVGAPAWSGAAVLAACALIAALLVGLFLSGAGTAGFVVVNVLAGTAVLGASAALFARGALLVPAGAPLATGGTLLVGYFILRLALEKRRAHIWRRRLENARQVTIESMAAVAETRDPETGAHIKRTQHYVRAIAEQLRRSGHYTDILTDEFIQLLFLSAPLHDIGKVGVPDHILLKPGPLTLEEMAIMKQHAEFGRRIIFSTAGRIEGDNFLAIAAEIAGSHHEKWDGTGYPLGLAGQAVPLSGRIMATADIYDALISRRCYKEPFTHGDSMALMRAMRSTTFDPVVLDAFFEIEPAILQIAQEFRDEEADEPTPVHAATELVGAVQAV